MAVLLCYTLSSTTVLAQVDSGNQAVPFYESAFVFAEQPQHVHSSSLVELPGGDLLVCWFQGSGERTADDVKIMGARLKKGNKTWSKPFLMADTPGFPDCNPVMFLDTKKRLHLVWVAVVANRWESSLLKSRISREYQGDGAPVWDWQDVILPKPAKDFPETVEKGFREMEIPERVWAEYGPAYEKMILEATKDAKKRETGWMPRIKPLVFPSGKIMLPLYSDGFNLSLTLISEDDGDKWITGQPIVGRGNIQPALVRKKDGTLVAWMRDSGDAPGRILVSRSVNEGNTWSPAVKSQLPNPGSSVEVLSLNDGNWIMVHNDLEEGRHRLAVSLSDDEGKTWKWKRYIEDELFGKGGFSYPAVIQTSEGLISLTYSHHTGDKKTIAFAQLNTAWIKEQSGKRTNAEKLGFTAGKKILLFHMDDAGMCEEANEAARNYITSGDVVSAAIMMPCPSAEDMVRWGIQHPKADLGVHLTLTSEWKTYRWGTLANPSEVPGLLDPDGKMWHDVPQVVMYATPEEVQQEITAQIDKVLAMGLKPTHIDTHMGTLYGSVDFVRVFLKTAEKYGIPANAIDLSDEEVAKYYREAGYPITPEVINLIENYKLPRLDNFTSVPNGKTYEEKRENFLKLISSLKPGLTEIIFHPSVYTENLKTITGSWQQRVWEAELFSDPVVKEYFRKNDIQFTTWREIMERFREE